MAGVKTENYIFKLKSGNFGASLHVPAASSGKLAVVLPGAKYSCKQALLYYSSLMLLENNFDVLNIENTYSENASWMNLKTMEKALQVVEEDSEVLFSAIENQIAKKIHLVLARSLGTFSLACALEKQIFLPKQIVWQSPSLNHKWDIIKKCKVPGLAIIGTADERLQTARPHLPESTLFIDGADHALEVPDNVSRSIEILKQVTSATAEWIRK